jgi:hypothetical protein
MRVPSPEQPVSPHRASARDGSRALMGRCPRAAGRSLSTLLGASGAFLAVQFVFGFALSAQAPTNPAPTPAQTPTVPAPARAPVHHRKKPSAAKPAAQSAPAPLSVVQAAPILVPCPIGSPAPAVSPAGPCIPNWPANNKPAEASIVWDSHGLFIQASNSSLDQILNDVSLKTGAKVEGMGADERVFGTYGPGAVRDVLTELLEGSGYNILLVGDLGQGTPRRIVLSGRPRGPAQPSGQSAPADSEDQGQMMAPEPPQTGPSSQPEIPGSTPPPPVPARFHQPLMQQPPEQTPPIPQQPLPNYPQNPQ